MASNSKKGITLDLLEKSKARIKEYEITIIYLQKLSCDSWILLPKISSEKLQINLQIENKTIEKNQVLIKIKRLVNCKSSKY